MNKKEAIEKMVTEMSSISQDQFRKLVGHDDYIGALPMWGTMWRLDYFGEELYENARVMAYSTEDIDLDSLDFKTRERVEKAIAKEDWTILEEYIDEEMAGARCILDKDGNTTAMYIYELDGEYWLGVNGAGWNFYEGVWDKLYDVCGLKWHSEEESE